MKLASLALALVLAVTAGGCVVALDSATAVDSFDKVLPLSAGGELSVSNVNGAVRVATWDRQEVRIEVEKKARGGSQEAARERLERTVVEISGGGDRVVVETKKARGNGNVLGWFGGGDAATVSYTITVPARADVEIQTVNGPVSVRDLVGRVQAGTVNGGIEISGIVGSVDAETVNGAIEVGLAALSGERGMKLETVNGGISLALPPDSHASLDASVTNGGIDCDLPLTDQDKSRRRLRGELGGGGVKIALETVNGGIDLVAR